MYSLRTSRSGDFRSKSSLILNVTRIVRGKWTGQLWDCSEKSAVNVGAQRSQERRGAMSQRRAINKHESFWLKRAIHNNQQKKKQTNKAYHFHHKRLVLLLDKVIKAILFNNKKKDFLLEFSLNVATCFKRERKKLTKKHDKWTTSSRDNEHQVKR